jgi:Protein of unknown function (DUF2695)
MRLQGSVDAAVLVARSWVRSLRGHGRVEEKARVVRQAELARLMRLGIRPDSLAGRLRLVLPTGCYGDFRFTRDILSTSGRREQTELAIQALVDLGARCDCEVFQAIGQQPRGVLWHHLPTEQDTEMT